MRTIRSYGLLALAWGVLSIVGGPGCTCAGASDPAHPPSDIAAPFQPSDIVKRARLAFRATSGNAFEAASRGAHVQFANGRLQWKPEASATEPIGLETVSIGRQRSEPITSTGAVRLEHDGHLIIAHDTVQESLRGVEAGVHQTFHFEGPPAGHGTLEVRLRITGARHEGETAAGHHFVARAGGLDLTYGPATWIDATGHQTPMVVRQDNDELVLTVDEATLESTQWPAVIDPIITTRSNVNQPLIGYTNLSSRQSAVAFDGTNYLVVWEDTRSISGNLVEINGARVTPSGEILDPGAFIIISNLAADAMPAVVFDGTNYVVAASDSSGSVKVRRVSPAGQVDSTGLSFSTGIGNNFGATVRMAYGRDTAANRNLALITWTDHQPGSSGIEARLIDTTTLTTIGSLINLPSGAAYIPAVAFDGTAFLVFWRVGSGVYSAPVQGARISTTGTLVDKTALAIGSAVNSSVAVAGLNGAWLATWISSTGLVAARVSDAGTLIDQTPLVLSPSISMQSLIATSDGAQFQVAWLKSQSGTADVLLNRVSADGVVLDGSGALIETGLSVADPALSCSALGCLATWTNASDIFGTRVSGTTPLDATPLHVSLAASAQDWPAVAQAGNQYLVVWADLRAGKDRQLYAARVSLTGEVLDPAGIELCSAADDQTTPRVAGTAAGDFYVVWADWRSPTSTYVDLYGTRVLADGTVVSPGGARLTTNNDSEDPSIASDGTGYLLTWTYSSTIRASRLGSDGTMLDNPPLTIATTSSPKYSSVSFGPGQYLVVFAGSDGNIRGVRVPPSGPPTDSAPLVLVRGDYPSVTFDGSQWLIGYRRYDSAASNDYMYAARVAVDGGVLDPNGLKLNPGAVSSSTSAYYRLGPEATFDGVDSVVAWATNYEGVKVYATWVHPDGGVFGQSTLVNVSNSIPMSATIAGQGDGDHSLLTYVYGDTTPGVRAFRVGSQILTFRVNGHPCGTAAECKSGYCVDGVCCDTTCNAGSTTDCLACSVAAGAAVDGTCSVVQPGRECRASTGACDVTDVCDGVSGSCVDRFAAADTVCRAATDVCDHEERCTGASSSCPADTMEPASTVCRPASGACDVAERCSGTAAACPGDGFANTSKVCRASAGACDPAETCPGNSAVCPDDLLSPATTTCRPVAGPCDLAETCTGASPLCPDEQFKSGEVCRPMAGPCDVEETCSGSSATCPGDSFIAPGTTCRVAAGPCDVTEQCTGSAAACPLDALQIPGVECRPAVGFCDVAETCSGGSVDCPSDAFQPSTQLCRVAAGACDAAEYCPGDGGQCPLDAFALPGTTCRPAAGACDADETCVGTSADCPPDAFQPPSVVCRPAVGPCDQSEACTGAAAACPTDRAAADGLACGAATTCSGTPACRAGQCLSGTPPSCDDHNACTADSCAEGSGCAHETIAGCCLQDADCGDDDACTRDSCVQHRCSHKAVADCCRTDTDCDDSNACTTDACVDNTCAQTPIDGCCSGDVDCDDGDDCTQDVCRENRCASTPVASCAPVAPAGGCGCTSGGESLSAFLVIVCGVLGMRRRRGTV